MLARQYRAAERCPRPLSFPRSRMRRPFPHTITTTQPPCSTCHNSNSAASNSAARNSQNDTLPSIFSLSTWKCLKTWRRAGLNTSRCLVGCSIGDFSVMWFLQLAQPDLSVLVTMGLSMAAGITTSTALETVMLRYGRDRLPLKKAFNTAIGMSMVSMLAMEMAENATNYYLTGGVVVFQDVTFWLSAMVSLLAGFMAPLPYNYIRLKKFGKSCH